MLPRIVGMVLLFGLLLQGWAQASAAASPPTECQGCPGFVCASDGSGCCPDGILSSVGCQVACGAGLALVMTPRVFLLSSSIASSRVVLPTRSDPDYVPLNPP